MQCLVCNETLKLGHYEEHLTEKHLICPNECGWPGKENEFTPNHGRDALLTHLFDCGKEKAVQAKMVEWE